MAMSQSPFQKLFVRDVPEIVVLDRIEKECDDPNKASLGVGVYRDDDGEHWVLPVVSKVERLIANDDSNNHAYTDPEGISEFNSASVQLLFGENHTVISENRVIGFQAVGGTGALVLAFNLLHKNLDKNVVLLPSPTYSNHPHICSTIGMTVSWYRYWDESTKGLDFDGMLEDLKTAPENAVVLFHAIAHNPTGVDPTREQWKQIEQVCKKKKLFVMFDLAYQGFATGDVEDDAWSVRYFADTGIDMLVATSFSKNFGLYGERVGLLAVVSSEAQHLEAIRGEVVLLARSLYADPPIGGAKIVAKILNNPKYYDEWTNQLKTMTERIQTMRYELVSKLKELGTPGTWDHIRNQIGMFSYTGLTPKQVEYMVSKNVFMLSTGRAVIAGLTTKNVDYVAKCIDEAVRLTET